MKERKIIAGIASMAMCLSSFTAMTVNAASYDLNIGFGDQNSLSRIELNDLWAEPESRSVEDGVMKVVSSTTASKYQKLWIDADNHTSIDNELVSVSFKVKRQDINTAFQLRLGGNNGSDDVVTMEANAYYQWLPDYSNATVLGDTQVAVGDWAEITIEFDTKNDVCKIYTNGVECGYYNRWGDTSAQQNGGKYMSTDRTALDSLYFAFWSATEGVEAVGYMDDIRVRSGIEALNEAGANADDAEEANAVMKKIEYYIGAGYDAALFDTSFINKFVLKQAENNIPYAGQNQKFAVEEGFVVTEVIVDETVIGADKYSVSGTELTISGDVFDAAKEYAVTVNGEGANLAGEINLTTDDRVIYYDENSDGTAPAENLTAIGAGSSFQWYNALDVSGIHNTNQASWNHFARQAGWGYGDANHSAATVLMYVDGNVRKAEFAKVNLTWKVENAGNYNVDVWQIANKCIQKIEVKDSVGVREYHLNSVAANGFTTLENAGIPSTFKFAGDGTEYIKISVSDKYYSKASKGQMHFAADCVRLRETYAENYDAEKAAVKAQLESKLTAYDFTKSPVSQESAYIELSDVIENAVGLGINIDEIAGISEYKNTKLIRPMNFNNNYYKWGGGGDWHHYQMLGMLKNENVLSGASFDGIVAMYDESGRLLKIWKNAFAFDADGMLCSNQWSDAGTLGTYGQGFSIHSEQEISGGKTLKLILIDSLGNMLPNGVVTVVNM